MERAIDTSVVITIYNRRELLKRTLLGYKRFGKHTATELVLVDDSSTDNVAEYIPLMKEVFQRVHYIVMDKKKSVIPVYFNNPALGINIGCRKAVGDLIIKTDPECYPLADNINVMREYMGYGKKRQYAFARTVMGHSWLNDALDKSGWLPNSEHSLLQKYPVSTSQVLISEFAQRGPWWYFASWRREDHEAIRGVDEEFLKGFAGDDDDHAERMFRSGVQLTWSDKMCVLHQWHTPPQAKVAVDKHQLNISRLHANRAAQRVVVNPNHEWGSPAAIVSSQIFE